MPSLDQTKVMKSSKYSQGREKFQSKANCFARFSSAIYSIFFTTSKSEIERYVAIRYVVRSEEINRRIESGGKRENERMLCAVCCSLPLRSISYITTRGSSEKLLKAIPTIIISVFQIVTVQTTGFVTL